MPLSGSFKVPIPFNFLWIGIWFLFLPSVFAQPIGYPEKSQGTRVTRASDYFDRGQVSRSLLELQKYNIVYGVQCDSLRHARALAYFTLGSRLHARMLWDSLIEERANSPWVPIAYAEQGLGLLSSNLVKSAIPFLSNASLASLRDYKSRHDTAYRVIALIATYWHGMALFLDNQKDASISVLRQVAKIDSLSTYTHASLYLIGQIYEQKEEYGSAVLVFRELRQKHPRSSFVIAARIREATNLLVSNKSEAALETVSVIDPLIHANEKRDFTRIPEQNFASDARSRVTLLRADARIKRGEHKIAYDTLREYLSLYQKSVYRRHALLQGAIAAMQIDSNATATVWLDELLGTEATADDEILSQAMLYKGIALKRMARTHLAEQHLKALAERPDYPFREDAHIEYGQIAYESSRLRDALGVLMPYIDRSTSSDKMIRAALICAAAYMDLKQWDSAVIMYDRAAVVVNHTKEPISASLRTANAEIRLKRGIARVWQKEHQKAIRELTDYLAGHPHDPRRDEGAFWLAEAFYHENLLRNAQEMYEEVVMRHTTSERREESLYGLAWTYFRRREFEKSVKTFGELLATFPASRFRSEAAARKGDAMFVLKQYAAAAEAYDKAATATDQFGEYASFQTGYASYKAGKLKEARLSMVQFVRKFPTNTLADDALYLAGWIEFSQGRYQEAISVFNRILSEYPASDQAARSIYTIGDSWYNLENAEEAKLAYRLLLRRFPENPIAAEAANALHMILSSEGKYSEAISVINDYIRANPESASSAPFMFRRAEMLFSGKQYEGAMRELQDYMAKHGDSERAGDALFLLGKTYLSVSDPVQATVAFSTLGKRYPGSDLHRQSLLDLGIYFAKTANASRSDSLFRVIWQNYPSDSDLAARAGFELAQLARQRDDTTTRYTMLVTTADRYINTEYGGQARYQLAMDYRKRRSNDSALYHFDVLVRQPLNPYLAAEALYRMGEILFRQKRYLEAIAQFNRLREDYSGYEDWHTMGILALGECMEAIGDTVSAYELYAGLADLRPDDDYGKAAKTRMHRLGRTSTKGKE